MDNTNKLIYGLIIILVIIGGLIYLGNQSGLLNMNKSSVYFYSNGVEQFRVSEVKTQGYTGYTIEFTDFENKPYYANIRNDPRELEHIEIDRTIFHKINNADNVFITINPNANLTGKTTVAALEINNFIDNKYFFNTLVNSSFTEPHVDLPNYTIMTCENATKTRPVIYLKIGEETKITSDNYCIIVEGKTEYEIIKAADRLVLYLIGVMP